MPKPDILYSQGVDNTEFIKGLKESVKETDKAAKKIDDIFEKANRNGSKSFGGISKQAGLSTKNIAGIGAAGLGAATGVLAIAAALTTVATIAGRVFATMNQRGQELNKTYELSEKILGNAFNNPELGKELVALVDELAEKFRADPGGAQAFAQRILPRSDSIETFEELLRLTDIQADVLGTTLDDLTFSITEALSGQFESIKDRFDLGPDVIQRIKDLSAEIGPSAALAKVLGDEFARLGKVDVAGGTLAGGLKDLRTFYDNLAQDLNDPIFDEVKEQIFAILQLLDANEETITAFANSIGNLAANVLDLLGTITQDKIEDAIPLIAYFTEVNNAISGVVDAVNFFYDALTSDTGAKEAQDALNLDVEIFEAIGNAIVAGTKALVIFKSGIAEAIANAQNLFTLTQRGLGIISDQEAADKFVDATEASNAVLREGADALDKYNQSSRDLEGSISSVTDAEESNSQATSDAANAFLAARDAQEAAAKAAAQAEKELAEAEAKAAEAAERIALATEKATRARENADLDLEIRQQRRLTDALIDNARAREDIARANANAVADIGRENAQDIEDAAKDLSREEADIARDGAREQRQIAQDEANQRLSIERDYRKQLESIRRTFEQSAADAERNNDAQAFVSAVRQRDNSVADATASRDSQVEEAKIAAQEQRESLKASLQAEIEDARIANAQKVEDLRDRLDQELSEQRIKNERDFEEQLIAEGRKEADRLERDARELADLERKFERKQEALDKSLEDEVAAVAAAEAAKTATIQQEEEKRTKIAQENSRKRQAARNQRTSSGNSGTAGVGGGIPILHDGGALGAGQTALVRNDESFFRAPSNGFVVPNESFSPPAMRNLTSQAISNVSNRTANINATPDMLSDPIMLDRLATAVSERIFQGLG